VIRWRVENKEASMTALRIGILGAAKIAPKAVIAPARNNAEFEVVAVAARDKHRAAAFASEHGIPCVAGTYDDLIGREDIDLVYVALPQAVHRQWSIAALEAGKAVLCEKPFAMNEAEARAMTTASERVGRQLIEAFHYRFHNVMHRAAKIVAAGELGRPLRAEAIFDVEIMRTPTELRWLPEQGGGALMDLGCYCIHALRTLAGCEPQVKAARCTVANGVDESSEAELLFANGIAASLSTTMKKVPYRSSLRLWGEKGSLAIENFIVPQDGCRFTVTADGRTRNEPTDGPSTYAAQLAHVGDVLLRGTAPLTGGADAVATMACIDAIYAAAGYRRG
jgi:predicted dehydrogenase